MTNTVSRVPQRRALIRPHPLKWFSSLYLSYNPIHHFFRALFRPNHFLLISVQASGSSDIFSQNGFWLKTMRFSQRKHVHSLMFLEYPGHISLLPSTMGTFRHGRLSVFCHLTSGGMEDVIGKSQFVMDFLYIVLTSKTKFFCIILSEFLNLYLTKDT